MPSLRNTRGAEVACCESACYDLGVEPVEVASG